MGNRCLSFSTSSASLRHKTDPSASLLTYKQIGSFARGAPQFLNRKLADVRTSKRNPPPVRYVKEGSVDTLRRYSRCSIVQNYIIVWLTSDIDANRESITYLQNLFHSFRVFTDIDEFFAFILHSREERLFLILSDVFARKNLSFIHKTPQLVAIYIMSNERSMDEQWIKRYGKIKGIFTRIESVSTSIQNELQLPENDTIPYEILNSSTTIVHCLIKTLLLHEIDHRKHPSTDFLEFARRRYHNELSIIDEFAQSYTPSKAIWWYTRKCFLYHALAQAFRAENLHQLILMGFFIRDLHEQITRSSERIGQSCPRIVYRGQGILENDVLRIRKMKNALFTFKNFLWTATDHTLSLSFAQSARHTHRLCGVLFRIEVSSSVSLVSLEKHSYSLTGNNEFLFSIDSLFRIRDIRQVEDQLWQVDLASIDHRDQQLDAIEGETAWQKLGFYFIESNQLARAEDLYTALLTCNCLSLTKQLSLLHEQLGFIYHKKTDSTNSLLHYKKSLRHYLTYLSPSDPSLLPVYLNIGILLNEHQNCPEAIRHFKYALSIALHSFCHDQLQISSLYHHLADVYAADGRLIDAVQHYQSALESELRHFPRYHSSVAQTCNTIGDIFYQMKDYSSALSYFEKTLKIQKKILSPNHVSLATTNYNLARASSALQQSREAIEYASRAVNIARHSLGTNHEDVRLYVSYLAELRRKTLVGVIPNGAVYE